MNPSLRNKVDELISNKATLELMEYCRKLEKLLFDTLDTIESNDTESNKYKLSNELVNNIISGIHVYKLENLDDDSTLRMVYANPMSEILTGVKVKDIIGKTLDENFPGLRNLGIPQAYAKVIKTGIPFNTTDLKYEDQRVIAGNFIVKAFPLPDNHVGVSFENASKIFVFQDELIEKEKLLKEQTEEYEATNEELIEANEKLHNVLLKLETSESRYKELIENINYGVLVYQEYNNGEDFIINSVNRGVEKIENVKRDDIVGKKITEVFPGIKEFGLFEILQHVYHTGKSNFFPASFYKDKRIEGWRECYVFKLPGGEVVNIYEDLTERKLTEKKIKVNQDIISQIHEVSSALTGEEYFDSVMSLLAETTGAVYSFIGSFDESNQINAVTSFYKGELKKGITISMNEQPCEKFIHEKKCCYIDHNTNDCRFKSFINDDKIDGCMGIPITNAQDKNIGVILALFDKRPVDINFIRSIFQIFSVRAAAELERKSFEKTLLENDALLKQQNERYISINDELKDKNIRIQEFNDILKQNEAYLNSIFKSAPIGIGVVKNRRFSFVNDRLCHITGYMKDELLDQSSRIIYPSDEEYEYVGNEKYRQIAEKGTGTVETQFKTKNGKIVDILLSSTPIDINNFDKGVTFSALDITQRKKATKDLDRIFELSADLISIATFDGILLKINPAFTTLFGYKTEEIIDQPVYSFIHLDDIESTKNTIQEKLIQNEPVITFHNRFRCKDNSYKWISWVTQPVHNENVFYCIAHDITEIKNAQQQLIESQKNLEEAQTLGQIGHYNFNISTGFWTNSKTLDAIFGIDHSFTRDVEGWSKIIHQDDREKMMKYFSEHVIGRKKEFDREYQITDYTTKETKWVHGKGNLEIDDKGNVLTMFGTIQDITDRKITEFKLLENERKLKEKNEELQKTNEQMQQINKELNAAKLKAEESDKLKTAFLANMSHEIRTPMNGIIGFVNLLMSEDLTSEKKEHYVDIINKSSTQLLTIISDIIDISKIEAEQIDIIKKDFDISEMLCELNEQFGSELERSEKSNLELICEFPDDNFEIFSDDIRIKQIFANLLNNAIKFTDEGYIKFGAYLNDRVIFYVEDTGIGIDPKNHHIIFERFRQEFNSDTREYGGTGLGLTISKALVEKLGGEIQVESEKNKGTRFTFSVDGGKIKKHIQIKDNQSPEPDEINWLGKKILIVEDTVVTQMLFEEILENTGAEYYITDSGYDAINKCKNLQPDIILMDIQLPDIDGYKTTMEIRKFNPDVPIIAQTAYAMSGDDKKALNSGCNDYISKPFDRSRVISVIDNFLKK